VRTDEGDDGSRRGVRGIPATGRTGASARVTGHLVADQVPDALAEAFAYAWQHRERVMAMDNASGYLYRVAQSKSRVRKQGFMAVGRW
jgi:hypothetical protein